MAQRRKDNFGRVIVALALVAGVWVAIAQIPNVGPTKAAYILGGGFVLFVLAALYLRFKRR